MMPLLPLTALLAQSSGPPQDGPNTMVMVLGVLAIFWLFVFLPERKAKRKKQELLESIQKNDRILLSSGIFATVAALGENEITVKFDDGQTRARVLRSAVQTVLDKDGDAAA